MMWLVLFAVAILLGWAAAVRFGGTAERETMCVLTSVWAATIITNIGTGDAAPILIYAPLDFVAVLLLFYYQRRNWQWIPAALFGAMLLTHLVYWSGTFMGEITPDGRPYQDILAGLGVLQILSVGWASLIRERARHGANSGLGRLAMASDYVLRRRIFGETHAGAR